MTNPDLRDLYQQVILDHARNPRNFGELECSECCTAEGRNPLCGDMIRIFIELENGVLKKVTFSGDGCAISKASASLMTESIRGKSVKHAQELFKLFHEMLTVERNKAAPDLGNGEADLGKLAVFSGVVEFPSRIKCASLAWHAMRAALAESDITVTTETGRGVH
jgi:nitrogen fixation NifU-like protein